MKIQVPRVRNTQTNKECPLETYQKLRKPTQAQQNRLSDAIYLGLSQRDYQRVGQMYADSFGLSAASVSRIFQKRSAQALSDYEDRDLSSQTYVVLMLDGVQFRGNQVVVCIGVTEDGEKHTLGFAQMETENAAAVRGLLKNLVARGFRYDAGILCVIDGAKGFQKAIQDVFGAQAKIQRCLWHKRKNILEKLKKKEEQEEIKKQFNAAHNQDTYDKARQKLMALCRDWDARGEIPAANSVREGLELPCTNSAWPPNLALVCPPPISWKASTVPYGHTWERLSAGTIPINAIGGLQWRCENAKQNSKKSSMLMNSRSSRKHS